MTRRRRDSELEQQTQEHEAAVANLQKAMGELKTTEQGLEDTLREAKEETADAQGQRKTVANAR